MLGRLIKDWDVRVGADRKQLKKQIDYRQVHISWWTLFHNGIIMYDESSDLPY